jgi:hypothetical protein
MKRLRAALPLLAPLAVDWAKRLEADAAIAGQPLDEAGQQIARQVGVQRPERIRIVVSDEMPYPEHPMLRAAALQTGLLGPSMAGLTLGYAVFIREGEVSRRLMSHEFRHVAQYEAAGSIDQFLPAYLQQVVEVGYHAAPYEVDARRHEIQG